MTYLSFLSCHYAHLDREVKPLILEISYGELHLFNFVLVVSVYTEQI